MFITGDAGSGKSALIQEFTQRTQESYSNVIVAGGKCNAQTGFGDPYLPFREILGLLTGDVEARWAGGTISRTHATSLWNSLPLVAKALVENGPDLIDTFIAGTPLINRIQLFSPKGTNWYERLKEASNRGEIRQYIPSPQQTDLFEQFNKVYFRTREGRSENLE